MGWLLWDWFRRLWQLPVVDVGGEKHDRKSTETIVVSGRERIVIRYRIGAEWFVWRYRPEQYYEALRKPAELAATGGVFDFRDAVWVTRAMREDRHQREAAQSATVV